MTLLIVLSVIADVVAIATAVFAFKGWIASRQLLREVERERERLRQPVRVVLTTGTQEYQLTGYLQRGELSRSELLGWIGMIPMREKGRRFALAFLSTAEFFEALAHVQQRDESESTLSILCSADEFAQFELVNGVHNAGRPPQAA